MCNSSIINLNCLYEDTAAEMCNQPMNRIIMSELYGLSLTRNLSILENLKKIFV